MVYPENDQNESHPDHSNAVLEKMHAPPKADHPVLDPSTLDQYDGIIIGVSFARELAG